MRTEREKKVERVFDQLPCHSSVLSRKIGLSRAETNSLMNHIRSEPVDKNGEHLYQYTVVYGTKGPAGCTYIPVLFEKDGSYYSDRHNLGHLEDGSIVTIKIVRTLLYRLARMVECFAKGVRPSGLKRYLEDLAFDLRQKVDALDRSIRRIEEERKEHVANG